MDFLFSPDIFIACTFLIVNSWYNVTSHVVFNVLWQGQASKLTIICSLLICLRIFVVCSLGFSPVTATVKERHEVDCSYYSLKWNNTRRTKQEFTRYWNQSGSHSMPWTRNRVLSDILVWTRIFPLLPLVSWTLNITVLLFCCEWAVSSRTGRFVWVSVGKSSVDTTVYVGRQKA